MAINNSKPAEKVSSNPWNPPAGWPSPMAPDAFYGLAGDVVRAVEPHTESDPAGLLLQQYAMFGNAIGSGPHCIVESDRHALNLFLLEVGLSGKSRKGTGLGHSRRIYGEVDPVWMSERVHSGLSSGEGLIKLVADRSESEPGVEDKRLLLIESEFGGTLRVMGRAGNSLSPVIRQAWDGGTLEVSTRKFRLKATGAHITIIAQTTEDDLSRYMTTTDQFNGFANRFLEVCVHRSKLLPDGGSVPKGTVDILIQRVKSAAGFARKINVIKRSQKANELWRAEYPKLTEGVPGVLGAVTSRAEAQVLRMAAICALMNGSAEVKTQHLRAALALWQYCFDSARFLFRERSEISLQGRLLQLLQRSAGGLTRTEMSHAFHNHRDSAAISSALASLRGRGLVMVRAVKTGGRSAERWFVADSGRTRND